VDGRSVAAEIDVASSETKVLRAAAGAGLPVTFYPKAKRLKMESKFSRRAHSVRGL